MRNAIPPVVVLAIGLIAGCHEPAQPTGPSIARVTVAGDEEFGRLWDMTADVLRAHNFWPDRQDRAARVMTSYPDTSTNWFEFWRPFPSTAYAHNEANFHAVRREVTVQFAPVANTPEYEMNVQVDVSRYCLQERQVSDAASAFQVFGARLPTTEGRVEPKQAGAYWESFGRDEAMELALIDRILRRFGTESYRVVPAEAPPETQPAAQ